MQHLYYLGYSLAFLSALIIIVGLRPDMLRAVWPIFILGAVIGPLSQIIYLHDYWRPDTVLGTGVISVEDVIFGASIYSLAIVTYPFFARKSIAGHGKVLPLKPFARLLLIGSLGVLLLATLVLGPRLNSIMATVWTFLLLWVLAVYRRRDLLIPTLLTGLAFAGVVSVGYALGLNFIAPHLLDEWWLLRGTTLGYTFLGIPGTEVLWFFSAGCFFPAFYMHATRQRYAAFSERRAPEPAGETIE